jgi:hypothetical protein
VTRDDARLVGPILEGVVVSVAVRDVLLFFTAAGLWGLSEMAPHAAPGPGRVAG